MFILTVLFNLMFAFSVARAEGATQAASPVTLALGNDIGAKDTKYVADDQDSVESVEDWTMVTHHCF